MPDDIYVCCIDYVQVVLVIRERLVRKVIVVRLGCLVHRVSVVDREQLVVLVIVELLELQVSSVLLDLLDGQAPLDPLDGLGYPEHKDGLAFQVTSFVLTT